MDRERRRRSAGMVASSRSSQGRRRLAHESRSWTGFPEFSPRCRQAGTKGGVDACTPFVRLSSPVPDEARSAEREDRMSLSWRLDLSRSDGLSDRSGLYGIPLRPCQTNLALGGTAVLL